MDSYKPWAKIRNGMGRELSHVDVKARDRMVAAAPDLVRALCWDEWVCNTSGTPGLHFDVGWCTTCGGKKPDHKPGCAKDAALTKAGVTPADREEVRRG